MGIFGNPDRPGMKDPELAALRQELDQLRELEHKDMIKSEVTRLRKKYGSQAEKTIDDRMREFWESKGIGVIDVKRRRSS
jgi:hypothetical protein